MWCTMMRGFAVLLGLSLLGSAALGASAPETTTTAAPAASQTAPQTAPQTPAAGTAEYRLGIGDVLGVVVLGESAYSGSFIIRADSSILFNDDMIGAVSVGGLTVAQATRVVTKRVSEFVQKPSVSVTVNRYKAMVVGQVRQPGQYDLESGARLGRRGPPGRRRPGREA